MNEKQPYEKHLGEKLQQLPPPGDANRSWEQMRSLLDKELPVGGRNGRGGAGRWWMMGIIVIILLSGSWFVIKRTGKINNHQSSVTVVKDSLTKETSPSSSVSLPADNAEENKNASHNKKEGAKENIPVAGESSHATNSVVSGEKTAENKNKEPVKAGETSTHLLTEKNKADVKTIPGSATNNNLVKKGIDKNKEGRPATGNKNIPGNNVKKDITGIDRTQKNKKDYKGSNRLSGNKNDIRGNTAAKNGKINLAVTRNNKENIDPLAKSNVSDAEPVAGINKSKRLRSRIEKNGASEPVSKPAEETLKPSVININTGYSAWLQASPAGTLGNSFNSNYSVYKLPESRNTGIAKQGRRYYKKPVDNNKSAKPRIVGTGDDKNFVIGLSLPLAFPLADQKAAGYNINAGVNTVSDYLPVPHFQYHFNDRSYLQSEIQFISPQFIQSVLLYQNKKELSQGATSYRWVTNSIYAKKLYYFNLPVAVHYSPFKNFYLGTGLQFSSLISGIALYEERGYNSPNPTASDSLFSQRFLKFRNDSVSHKLNGSEFRLLLDANYYWKRFTVGLRYNQALSNYVNIRVTTTSPYFEDKNKSLQFYLRYNLWEDKKHKKTNALTFK